MANEFVKELESGVISAFASAERFLALCPDDVWQKKFGCWFVSQEFYHAMHATNRFVAALWDEKAADPCPKAGERFPEEGVAAEQATKGQAGEFLANLKALVEKNAPTMRDADLLKTNEGASKRTGHPISNAATLVMVASHIMYHLGGCYAAARAQGLDVGDGFFSR